LRLHFDAAAPNPAVLDKGPGGPLAVSGGDVPEDAGSRLMTDKATEIATLLAPTVQSLGLELLGVEYLAAPGGALLRLYIDVPADAGEERTVGIEDCEATSREVSAQLDVADPISAHYTLEVSSPGVDRPLFTAAQFARFTGETAKVALKLPQDGRRRLQGAITAVDGDRITFDVDGIAFVVAIDNIEKARLVPDWAALGLAPAVDKSGRDLRPGKTGKAGREARPSQKNPTKKPAAKPSRAE
jgi:ribosome maturation factor RimP